MTSSFFCKNLLISENHKTYIAMLLVQFVYAGMALFSKAAVAQGMNPFVFVVYRQAFASFALAPFAFFLERLYIFAFNLSQFLKLIDIINDHDLNL